MLTKKQIEKLPNGFNSNTEIAKLFPSHGKKIREMAFPVNQKGEIVQNPLNAVEMQIMRLGRSTYRKYKK
jgi:hypothetical protein